MKFRLFLFVMFIGTVFFLTGCNSTGKSAAKPSEDPKIAAAKADAVKKIKAMIADKKAYTTEEIMPLYEQLDPIDIDFMLGQWKGGKFDAGKMPDPINWYGKRFNSRNNAEPLLARKPDGEIYSFSKWGMAQLRMVEYKGKVSATLIYDLKPIMDYFRKVDENTLIGLGDFKGNLTFFFHLTREEIKK